MKAGDSEIEDTPSRLDVTKGRHWLNTTNYLLEFHTMPFGLCYFGLRGATLLGIAAQLQSWGYMCSPEWIVAWIFSRAVAKWRQPANFAVAAVVRKLFPKLELIRFSRIFQYRPAVIRLADTDQIDGSSKQKPSWLNFDKQQEFEESYPKYEMNEARDAIIRGYDVLWEQKVQTWTALNPDMSEQQIGEKRFLHIQERDKHLKRMERLDYINQLWAGPLDRFGMPWYVSSKLTSLVSVMGVVVVMNYGLADVVSYLYQLGERDFSETFSGALAGAWVLNTAFIPVHFYMTSRATKFWANDPKIKYLA